VSSCRGQMRRSRGMTERSGDQATAEERTILVVDDESSLRHMLRLVLEGEGYEVIEAEGGESALSMLQKRTPAVILCDVRMPGMDGMAFLQEIKSRALPSTTIMMSAYGAVDTALQCMREGAYDYISKPFKPDEVVLTIRKAEERLRMAAENRRLKEELRRTGCERRLVYRSPEMENIMCAVERVADSLQPVLITGETGTGKELVARAIHELGGRKDRPFVAVNCSAIAPTLMESEIFGHVRGSFTGADRDKAGLFQAAHKGTLFLDEVGELPMELQPKFLRVLQEGEILRVGDSRPIKVDVRILAATARDLSGEQGEKRFRDDLFYRLAVLDLHIPPLRERRQDIELLTRHFLERIAARENRQLPAITEEALEVLMGYHWPGNVRELENLMEKTMIFCRSETIDLSSLPWETRRKKRDRAEDFSLKRATVRLEKEFIRKSLAATSGNRTKAAELLEISLRALLYKIKDYNIS
jgi:DNA-binding NtrC family response regulator